MNKSESLDEHGLLTAAAGEAHKLGFGDPVAISAETGLGMAELYEILRPLFEEYMFQLPNSKPVEIYAMVWYTCRLFLSIVILFEETNTLFYQCNPVRH
jgi:predicted GTPase